MAVVPPPARVYRDRGIKNAGQAMAEKREDYGMLCRALAEFPADVITQACAVVDSEALYRAEKVSGPLRWFSELHATRATLVGRARDNVTWRAVATAPAGFCHVRSSMTGTLLEDIAAGLPFESVKRKFADKMDPTKYRRPTAAPSDGAIAQAEVIVAALASAGSLRRRFARLEDVVPLWKPGVPVVAPPAAGVFGHLKTAAKRSVHPVIKAPLITWEKFQRTVLGDAETMEIAVPGRGAFIALVTAADPTAPPIIQWDSEAHRNPVSWYVFPNGSAATDWSLTGGTYAKVTAVTNLPFMWPGTTDHGNHGAGVIFIIEGAKGTRHAGSALFPELLRSEYHGVRSVLERYSGGAKLEGRDEASACGLEIRKGSRHTVTVRVTSKAGAVTEYTIDRWD